MSAPTRVADRLAALRALMKREGVDAYHVPSGDQHQSEYVPARWRRREWLSGFTGSSGFLHVGLERAWLWTDSRYWLQAEQELQGSGFELTRAGGPGVPSYVDWLAQLPEAGRALGVDPRLQSVEDARKWRKALEERGATLQHVERNLVDEVWGERPPHSKAPLRPHAVRWSGEAPLSKLSRVAAALDKARCEALVVTTLDSIAWLLDLRGSDVDFNPVFVASCIVEGKAATLFVDPSKVTQPVRDHLPSSVTTRPYEDFGDALAELARRGARVLLDPARTSAWVAGRLVADGKLHEAASPIEPMKARKNDAEVAGARRCHVRDGVALVRLLAWLEREVAAGRAVTEIDAAERLAALRGEGEHFQGLSFETISAFGDHAAVVHYRPGAEGRRVIDASSLFLLDSGGQYLDGTTDVTRTTCYGEPTPEQRACYTRVLRGHVDLARATFPTGTTGKNLDVLARSPLWSEGLDYGHGTGHGVGAYLCVHEGPQRIALTGPDVALEPGMIVSNEPGYYRSGQWGIRIESLVVVVERPGLGEDGKRFLGFDTLTACPIDRTLVEPSLLDAPQRAWLDGYHDWVRQALSPHLAGDDLAWLTAATLPI